MLATTAIAEPQYMKCGKDYTKSRQMGKTTILTDGPTLSLDGGVVTAKLTQAGGAIAFIQTGGIISGGGTKRCDTTRYFAAKGRGQLADGNRLSIGTEITVGVSNPTASALSLCFGNGTPGVLSPVFFSA